MTYGRVQKLLWNLKRKRRLIHMIVFLSLLLSVLFGISGVLWISGLELGKAYLFGLVFMMWLALPLGLWLDDHLHKKDA